MIPECISRVQSERSCDITAVHLKTFPEFCFFNDRFRSVIPFSKLRRETCVRDKADPDSGTLAAVPPYAGALYPAGRPAMQGISPEVTFDRSPEVA